MDESLHPVLEILARRMARDIEAAVMRRAAQLAVDEPDFHLDIAWMLWAAVHEQESLMRAEWMQLERRAEAGDELHIDLSGAESDELRNFVTGWLQRNTPI